MRDTQPALVYFTSALSSHYKARAGPETKCSAGEPCALAIKPKRRASIGERKRALLHPPSPSESMPPPTTLPTVSHPPPTHTLHAGTGVVLRPWPRMSQYYRRLHGRDPASSNRYPPTTGGAQDGHAGTGEFKEREGGRTMKGQEEKHRNDRRTGGEGEILVVGSKTSAYPDLPFRPPSPLHDKSRG